MRFAISPQGFTPFPAVAPFGLLTADLESAMGARDNLLIQQDHDVLKAKIPDDVWREMRKAGLVAPNAPRPIDR